MKPVGGRGKKAPYETTHIRVPVEIKAEIEMLIEIYRQEVLSGDGKNDLDSSESEPKSSQVNHIEASVIAKGILAHKRSARESLGKLLTAIYKIKTNL